MAAVHKELTAPGPQPDKKIAVLDSDRTQGLTLCELLKGRDYQAAQFHSLADLNFALQEGTYPAVIIDLDTVSLDNRTIRELAQKNPGVCFLCLSSKRFHPELKDAICYHIYACINKPVDPDEIFYFLKSIFENEGL